jgi:hypothetical protein
MYRALPPDIRRHARAAYRLWRHDPRLSGLRFKLVDPNRRVYSVRITGDHRALGRLEGDTIVWYFIGTHDDYMRAMK